MSTTVCRCVIYIIIHTLRRVFVKICASHTTDMHLSQKNAACTVRPRFPTHLRTHAPDTDSTLSGWSCATVLKRHRITIKPTSILDGPWGSGPSSGPPPPPPWVGGSELPGLLLGGFACRILNFCFGLCGRCCSRWVSTVDPVRQLSHQCSETHFKSIENTW